MLKKYKLPVFANEATLNAIRLRADLPEECCRILPESMELGGVKVETSGISHDAVAPVFFNFFEGKLKCIVATDLGFVTPAVRQALRLSDILVLVFEANHDLDMLQTGEYPWYLKKRIMSNKGHLSNVEAGNTLTRLDRPVLSKVFLAHIS